MFQTTTRMKGRGKIDDLDFMHEWHMVSQKKRVEQKEEAKYEEEEKDNERQEHVGRWKRWRKMEKLLWH